MGNYPHHVQIIADSNTWIEGNAVAQLETTARLPHMLRVAGMPDLHAGRGYPVGAAFFSDRHFYPALIGNDIGCGMAFCRPICAQPNSNRPNLPNSWAISIRR